MSQITYKKGNRGQRGSGGYPTIVKGSALNTKNRAEKKAIGRKTKNNSSKMRKVKKAVKKIYS